MDKHKLEIRQKKTSTDTIMTGANTEILIDGKPMKGISRASFVVEAGSVAHLLLEMYADVTISSSVDVITKKKKARKRK